MATTAAVHRLRRHVGTRMPGRDRGWRGTHTTVLLAGLDAPGAGALRGTLRDLAALDPEHRIFHRPGTLWGPTGEAAPAPSPAPEPVTRRSPMTRWFPVPRAELAGFCDRLVVPIDVPTNTDDLDLLQTQLHHQADPAVPFQVLVGENLVALSVAHPLLDGRPVVSLLAELTARALDGQPPAGLVGADPRHPLTLALADHFGRSPGRLLAVARAHRGTNDANSGGNGAGDGRRLVWSPDVASVSVTSDPDLLSRLHRWRIRNARGVTRTAVFFAAARAALVEAGLTPAPGLHVLVDNRRYLPGAAGLTGNFSVGVHLDPPDALDPASVAATLDAGLGAGRPLATMALVAARAQRRRPPPPPDSVPSPPQPAMVVNYLGRLRELERLPWLPDLPSRLVTASTPGHPELVTFAITQLMGRLQVSASFHASAFDPARIRSAVHALCADPSGLLDRAGRACRAC